MLLDATFYQRPDVVAVARELLGKHLCTNIEGQLTTGRIVETEAYRHAGDDSMTLHRQRKRQQARALLAPGGVAYIYAVYRVHSLFNIVCNAAGYADTVLIRAVEPVLGVSEMLRRRGLAAPARNLTAGPGLLCQALGLTPSLSGEPLMGPTIWVEDHGESLADEQVRTSSRVGLAYAGPAAVALPWRFRVLSSPWTSPAR